METFLFKGEGGYEREFSLSLGRNFVGNWLVNERRFIFFIYFIIHSWGRKLVDKGDPRNP